MMIETIYNFLSSFLLPARGDRANSKQNERISIYACELYFQSKKFAVKAFLSVPFSESLVPTNYDHVADY